MGLESAMDQVAFNQDRLIRAHRDFSVSGAQVKAWEAEGLAAVDRWAQSAVGIPDSAWLKESWRLEMQLPATTALMERIRQRDQTISREEVIQRVRQLKMTYLSRSAQRHEEDDEHLAKMMHVALQGLEGRRRPTPVGLLLLVLVVVAIVYFLFIR